MTRPHLPAVVFLVLLLLSTRALAGTTPPPPRLYAMTILPADGYDFMHIQGLNEAGHAVGIRTRYYNEYNSENYGFFWSQETGIINLGLNYRPLAINNSDAVVGLRYDRAAGHSSWMWSAGSGFQPLPFRDALDINDAGQILGRVDAWPSVNYGVVLNPDGTRRNLPLARDAKDSFVGRLTPSGDVSGWMTADGVGTSDYRGTLWPASGGYQVLPGLPGWERYSFAGEMNREGIIIGSSAVYEPIGPHGMQRAVYWDAEHQVHDMGTLPGALTSGPAAINDSGEIVGWSASMGGPGKVPWRAFLFTTAEGMLDLNDLIDDPGDHWILTHGQAITEGGLIAADARHDGKAAAVILRRIPNYPAADTPEPSTLVLLAAASLLVLRRPR